MPQLPSDYIADSYASAINARNVQDVTALTEFPVSITHQEWEYIEEGNCFQLGKRTRLTFDKPAEFSEYLESAFEKMQSQNVTGNYITKAEYTGFKDEFGPYAADWEQQDTYFYDRAFEHVAHLLILGVDKTTGKVEQLYFN